MTETYMAPVPNIKRTPTFVRKGNWSRHTRFSGKRRIITSDATLKAAVGIKLGSVRPVFVARQVPGRIRFQILARGEHRKMLIKNSTK